MTLQGQSGLLDMVGCHFKADLSDYVDECCLITWFIDPDGAGAWGAGVGPDGADVGTAFRRMAAQFCIRSR